MRSAHVRLTAADASLSPGRWARAARVVRATLRSARRALLTMRPTWAPLLAAVVVVTPTAAAVATWATLPPTGGALHLPRVQMALGASSVDAAAGEPAPHPSATATADPRLQPGYIEPATPVPARAMPRWLPPSVTRWEALIADAAGRHDVDPALVAIIVLVESGGNPMAVSPAGATGLMQVMPLTAGDIARTRGLGAFDAADLRDPVVCVDFGTWYLSKQLLAFGISDDPDWQTSVERAAAAYNGGPGAAGKWLRGGALPGETVAYVQWVGGMWRERGEPTSPTYDAWLAAGGGALVDRSAAVPGPPPLDEHDAAPPRPSFPPRVAPGVPLPHLEARTGG